MMGYGNYWGSPNFNFLGGMMAGWLGFFLVPFILWSLFWKGWALWKSARAGSKGWFVVLLILNTLGILEIIYIFLVSKEAIKSSKK